MPLKELKGFKRVSIQKGAANTVVIRIPVRDLAKWDMVKHGWKVYPGAYKLFLGENAQDERASVEFSVD